MNYSFLLFSLSSCISIYFVLLFKLTTKKLAFKSSSSFIFHLYFFSTKEETYNEEAKLK